jgi:hypothetical protein
MRISVSICSEDCSGVSSVAQKEITDLSIMAADNQDTPAAQCCHSNIYAHPSPPSAVLCSSQPLLGANLTTTAYF